MILTTHETVVVVIHVADTIAAAATMTNTQQQTI
jgi:hypothetical protein